MKSCYPWLLALLLSGPAAALPQDALDRAHRLRRAEPARLVEDDPAVRRRFLGIGHIAPLAKADHSRQAFRQ